jgi:lysophospholipase L1-like esterase
MRLDGRAARWLGLGLTALLLVGGSLVGCSDGGSDKKNTNDNGDTTNDPQDGTNGDGNSDDGTSGDDSDSGFSSDIGNNDPNTLAAIGDSITAGSTLSGPSYPSRLAGLLGKQVLNRGVPGAYSSAAPGHAGSALGSKPSYLLLMYGTNDVFQEVPSSTVAANVQAAVQLAKANRTIPVVATIPPNLRSTFQNGLVASINSRLKAMASSERVRVADVNREFGSGEGLIQTDGYHPNETGAQIIAFTFADAVR